MYIYWSFICCVYVVTYDRRGSKSACIFLDFFEREVVSPPPSLDFFAVLHHLLWLGVSICEIFWPWIFKIFSLSLALDSFLSFLSIFWSYWYAEVVWNYQSTFPDLLCSFNAFMLRQYKGVYTNCYTRVYRVHICVHMCNTHYLSNLLLWLLIIKNCCPFESCWLFVCLCVFFPICITAVQHIQWNIGASGDTDTRHFLFVLSSCNMCNSLYALQIILNW